MEYPITITRDKYYKASLSVINCWMNLTDLELDILATMLNHKMYILNKESRKVLQGTLNKNNFNLNNYIKRLKEKKVLLDTENKELTINPNIISATNDPTINITFKIDE